MITEPPATHIDLQISPLELQKGQNACKKYRFWAKRVISRVVGGGRRVGGSSDFALGSLIPASPLSTIHYSLLTIRHPQFNIGLYGCFRFFYNPLCHCN
jgi:hypothetical protein